MSENHMILCCLLKYAFLGIEKKKQSQFWQFYNEIVNETQYDNIWTFLHLINMNIKHYESLFKSQTDLFQLKEYNACHTALDQIHNEICQIILGEFDKSNYLGITTNSPYDYYDERIGGISYFGYDVWSVRSCVSAKPKQLINIKGYESMWMYEMDIYKTINIIKELYNDNDQIIDKIADELISKSNNLYYLNAEIRNIKSLEEKLMFSIRFNINKFGPNYSEKEIKLKYPDTFFGQDYDDMIEKSKITKLQHQCEFHIEQHRIKSKLGIKNTCN